MSDYTYILTVFWVLLFYSAGSTILLYPQVKDFILSNIDKRSMRRLAFFLSTTIGLVHIIVHNEWSGSSEIIVSSLGWISIVKGFLLLLFPRLTGVSKYVLNSEIFFWIGVITLIAGIYLFSSLV